MDSPDDRPPGATSSKNGFYRRCDLYSTASTYCGMYHPAYDAAYDAPAPADAAAAFCWRLDRSSQMRKESTIASNIGSPSWM